MGTGVGQRNSGMRVAKQVFHRVFVEVEHLAIDQGVHLAVQGEIQEPIEGVFTGFTCQLADDLADQLLIILALHFLDPHMIPLIIGEPIRHPFGTRLVLDLLAKSRIGQ